MSVIKITNSVSLGEGSTLSRSPMGPPSCKPAVFGMRRPTTVPPAPAPRALLAFRLSELVPSRADDEEGRPFEEEEGDYPSDDDDEEPIPHVGRPLVIQAVESELELAKKAYSEACSEEEECLASLNAGSAEHAENLRKLPECIKQLLAVIPTLSDNHELLNKLNAAFAAGAEMGKNKAQVCEELAAAAVPEQTRARDVALANRQAAYAALHAFPNERYRNGPDRARVERDRARVEANNQRNTAPLRAAIARTIVIFDAAQAELNTAKQLARPNSDQLKTNIDQLTAQKDTLETELVLLAQSLMPVFVNADQFLQYERSTMDLFLRLQAAEKKEKFGGVVALCMDGTRIEYDENGDLLGEPVEASPANMMDLIPIDSDVSSLAHVCQLGMHHQVLERLYPDSNIISLLTQLDVMTRSVKTTEVKSRSRTQSIAYGADGRPVYRGEFTINGSGFKSAESSNPCNYGIQCNNAACRYSHPLGWEDALAKAAEKKAEAQADHSLEDKRPVVHCGSGRMSREDKIKAMTSLYMAAVAGATTSRAFHSIEAEGVSFTTGPFAGHSIYKGVCLVKVIELPGGTQFKAMLVDGKDAEIHTQRGIKPEVDQILLVAAGIPRCVMNSHDLQAIETKLTQLTVEIDPKFFAKTIQGELDDEFFEDAAEVAPETVSSSSASRIVSQSLPDYMLPPPMEDEYEEEDEAPEAPVLTVAALPVAALPVAALPAAVEAPESDAEDSEDEGISALAPTGKKSVKKGNKKSKKGKKGGKGGR